MSSRATALNARSARARRPATIEEFFTSELFILGVLLVAVTAFIYYPASQFPFLNFDDPAYVVNNSHIASGWSLETISWAFTTFYQFNWHPLTWLSHAQDMRFFGLKPAGHHVVNVLFQAANVLLLYFVLQRATGYVGRSAMVAGLFALHPINIETVAWIAERKNLLSMFFFLLGMAAYRSYAAAPLDDEVIQRRRAAGKSVEIKPDPGRYALMTLFFALGLMSKPQIITFPFILLLWDYWPLGRVATSEDMVLPGTVTEPLFPKRSFWWLVKEKVPLFVICAASAAVTVVAQRAGGAMASLQNYPLSVRLTNAIVSYARYLGKAVWPTHLAPLYPHPWYPLPLWQVLLSLLLLVAITVLVMAARSRRYLLVGWLWFLGALVPMSGVVQVGNQAMADRYAYLPFIGLFLMVCWGIGDLAEARRVPTVVMRAFSIVVFLMLALLMDRQLSYWSDNVSLWQHTLAITDSNYIAHDNLAAVLMSEGHDAEALAHYQAALAIYPSDPFSNLAVAAYDHQHGHLLEALARYQKITGSTPAGPARAELFSKQGLVYLDMRDSANAQSSFAQAVAMDPENVQGWLGLGVVAEQSGNLDAAVDDYQHAVDARPVKVAYQMLARVLDKKGESAAAEGARQRAKLLPGNEKMTQTFSGGILQK